MTVRKRDVLQAGKPVLGTRGRRFLTPYLYLFPAGLLFAVFTYIPLFKTISETFFTQNRRGDIGGFVGFENYVSLLSDQGFLSSIGNTIFFALASTPVAVLIGLVLAVATRKVSRLSGIYETVFAATIAVSMSVASLIFQLVFNPTVGILNQALGTDVNWLRDPKYAMGSIVVIAVWLSIGYNFIFLLAAVRGVDSELIEASMLDGANVLQRAWRILVPIISPTVFFLIVSQLAENLMMSGFVLILTSNYSTSTGAIETMVSYMYRQATVSFDYNNAYAAAVVAFTMALAAVILAFWIERKKVHYS